MGHRICSYYGKFGLYAAIFRRLETGKKTRLQGHHPYNHIQFQPGPVLALGKTNIFFLATIGIHNAFSSSPLSALFVFAVGKQHYQFIPLHFGVSTAKVRFPSLGFVPCLGDLCCGVPKRSPVKRNSASYLLTNMQTFTVISVWIQKNGLYS